MKLVQDIKSKIPIGFKPLKQLIIYIPFVCLLTACENDMNEVNRLTKSNQPQFDYAEEIEILYSVRLNL